MQDFARLPKSFGLSNPAKNEIPYSNDYAQKTMVNKFFKVYPIHAAHPKQLYSTTTTQETVSECHIITSSNTFNVATNSTTPTSCTPSLARAFHRARAYAAQVQTDGVPHPESSETQVKYPTYFTTCVQPMRGSFWT